MKLKEFATINMGQSPKGETYNTNGNGMPFLQGRKTFGRIYPTIATWTTNPIKIANKNEILMSVRAPVGDMNFANQQICIGRGLCSINAKNGRNKYLYYMLLNSMNDLKQKSTGTVFDSINRNDLENLEIDFHSEESQEKIENILGNIDSKIELNNEINNNLHELLKNQYRKMFVDDRKDTWIDDKLGNYLSVDRGLSYKGQFLSETGVPMINLGNVMPNGVFRIEKNKYYSGDYKDKVTVKVGDIVIANTDMTQNREVIGTPVIVPPIYDDRIIFSHHIYGLRNLKLPKMYIFYTMLTDEWNAIAGGSATGTTVLALPKETIENYDIVIPDSETLQLFENVAESIQTKRNDILLENIKLEQLRDTILPKLMNGEIDLSNIVI